MQFPSITTLSLLLALPLLSSAKCPIITRTVQAPLCPTVIPPPPATPTAKILAPPRCIALACQALSTVSVPCGCPTTVPTSTYTLPCTSPGPCPGGCQGTSWQTVLPATKCATIGPVPTTTTGRFITLTKSTSTPCFVCATAV